jgi:hypothetical protein
MLSHARPNRRTPVTLLAPAAATFAVWWLFLGFDADDQYAVAQCAGLLIVLVAVGGAGGWWARPGERAAVAVGAAAGISAGCFTAWMDDESGLFLVGWMLLTPVAFLGAAVVVGGTALVRDRLGLGIRGRVASDPGSAEGGPPRRA